jgi:ketosteroid isomerase-like protein
MKTVVLATLLYTTIIGVNVSNAASNQETPAERLAATEKAFAQMSLDSGMTAAFLRYLHDEAVVFRPGPISGKRWYQDRTNNEAILNWRPEFVEVSSAGDLGYSTGPWEYRSSRSDTATYYGRFVSVWQRQADGSYMVMADLGIDHDPIELPVNSTVAELSTLPLNAPATVTSHDSLVAELKAAEAAFSKASTEASLSRTLQVFGDSKMRILRPGKLPWIGAKAADSLLSSSHLLNDTRFADVAASGDLGYTYGFFTHWPVGTSPTQGTIDSYLRVWKKVGSAWKIALDIALPMKK